MDYMDQQLVAALLMRGEKKPLILIFEKHK
jgi:hypothetical protein